MSERGRLMTTSVGAAPAPGAGHFGQPEAHAQAGGQHKPRAKQEEEQDDQRAVHEEQHVEAPRRGPQPGGEIQGMRDHGLAAGPPPRPAPPVRGASRYSPSKYFMISLPPHSTSRTIARTRPLRKW